MDNINKAMDDIKKAKKELDKLLKNKEKFAKAILKLKKSHAKTKTVEDTLKVLKKAIYVGVKFMGADRLRSQVIPILNEQFTNPDIRAGILNFINAAEIKYSKKNEK